MVQIIKAAENHIESITFLWKKLMDIHKEFDKDYFSNTEGSIYEYEHNIEWFIKNDSNNVFIAVKDEVLVGYITAEFNFFSNSMYNSNSFCTVCDIMILPNFQHMGIGKALIEEVKNWANSNNINQIELFVFSKNANALKFFKNQGFEDQFNKLELKF